MKMTSNVQSILPRIALMLAVYALLALPIPSYYSAAGLAALLDGAVLTGIIGIGVGLTMIAGEMDLSVGSMAALAGIAAVNLFSAGFGVVPTLLAVALLCALIGAVQGWCICKLNINSMVFTIGTLIGLRGLALVVSHEKTALIPFKELVKVDFLAARIGIFSPLSLTMLVLFAVFAVLMRRTVFGLDIYAIGGGRTEARAAGVSISRPLVIVFAASAGLAGLAGSLLSLKAGSASPIGYDSVVLEAVTACLIGGIALSGGRGGVGGVLVGLLTIRILVSGIAALGAPFWLQSLATGGLLIFVIVAEAAIQLIARRRFSPPQIYAT